MERPARGPIEGTAAVTRGAVVGEGGERAPVAFILAWILSVVPLALDAFRPGSPLFPGSSSFGLVLIVWLALAGLPDSSRVAGGSGVLASLGRLVGASFPPWPRPGGSTA